MIPSTNYVQNGVSVEDTLFEDILAVRCDFYGCWARKRKLISSFGSLFGAWNNKYLIFDKTNHRFSYKKFEHDQSPTHIPFFVQFIIT